MKDLGLVAIAVALVVVAAIQMVNPQTVVTNDGESFGAFPGTEITSDLVVHGSIAQKTPVVSLAPTSVNSTTTLRAKDSGTDYFLSASGTSIILPAVGNKGSTYRFTVGGSLDSANVVIDSLEGDNIDGTLIVAGAVVDCRGEDQINFVTDGEAVGDYVEVLSNGTQWVIVDSGVLTTAKMTCTDPS